ncbi:hypothetical protein FH972_022333 [Carpinus fangiana]|uniref:Ubiquitin-like protease family profile domain-containing protein n=1 Tax=Carpinus fangiana TaxID=176857 RepID=A0A5N6KSH9_9ROSI|nr:hypothetical protein FH972_022333 [Carpinus fangiana]
MPNFHPNPDPNRAEHLFGPQPPQSQTAPPSVLGRRTFSQYSASQGHQIERPAVAVQQPTSGFKRVLQLFVAPFKQLQACYRYLRPLPVDPIPVAYVSDEESEKRRRCIVPGAFPGSSPSRRSISPPSRRRLPPRPTEAVHVALPPYRAPAVHPGFPPQNSSAHPAAAATQSVRFAVPDVEMTDSELLDTPSPASAARVKLLRPVSRVADAKTSQPLARNMIEMHTSQNTPTILLPESRPTSHPTGRYAVPDYSDDSDMDDSNTDDAGPPHSQAMSSLNRPEISHNALRLAPSMTRHEVNHSAPPATPMPPRLRTTRKPVVRKNIERPATAFAPQTHHVPVSHSNVVNANEPQTAAATIDTPRQVEQSSPVPSGPSFKANFLRRTFRQPAQDSNNTTLGPVRRPRATRRTLIAQSSQPKDSEKVHDQPPPPAVNEDLSFLDDAPPPRPEKHARRRAASIIKPISEGWKDQLFDTLAEDNFWAVVTDTGITRKDLGTVVPFTSADGVGWLNDEIVNAYLTAMATIMLERDGYDKGDTDAIPGYHAFSTHLYTSWKARGWTGVSRWFARARVAGKRLLSCRRILIPVNDRSHWTLLAVSGTDRTIEYYDSMGGPGPEYIRFALDLVRNTLGPDFVESEWQVNARTSQIQVNALDCGVFVCMNALALITNRVPEKAFMAAEMPHARMQVAATLLNEGFSGEFSLE